MSYPRYPKYKPCRDHWIASIPDHWEFSRLKRACKVFPSNVDKKSYDDEPSVVLCNYTDVYYNERITRDLDFMEATATNEQVAKFTLRAGDVIITKDSETADDIAVAAYVPQHLPGVVCGYHLSMIRPYPHVSGAFVKRLFDSAYTKGRLATLANGLTRVGLGQYQLDNLELPIPPLKEQEQIVDFLDSETAKIDSLIDEQQKLIELLSEKRQAVISNAVTKGLNPNAVMRPSGVEWLGNIPGHWQVQRLASLLQEVSDPGVDDLPILSVSIHHGVSDREINEEEMERKVIRSEDRTKYKRVEPGDLVYNMMRAWQGGFGTVTTTGMVSPAYVVARPRKPMNTKFIEHVLRTPMAVEQMRRQSRGITDFRLRLYWDEFKNIQLAFPPDNESRLICARISEMEQQFDELKIEADKSISVLLERRTAVISAAVTGKIDVRHFVNKEAV